MLKIGITGGIGSGKSTICKVWQALGAFIINADDLAKEIMVSNEFVKRQIMHTFGKQSYHPGGALNRKYLAEQAFGKERVEQLNAIVHPKIPSAVDLQIQKADKLGKEICVYEAALLLQNVRPPNLDRIVLVLAARQNRIGWIKKRDKIDESLVMNRMHKQQDFETLTHKADIVIKNNGSLEQLKQKAHKWYETFETAKN